MSTAAAELPPAGAAAALLQQLMRARAVTLARAGSLQAAAGLLQAEIEAGSEAVATLDLLARVRAQSGDWSEAEKLWLQVARQQPGHAGAAAGLSRLRSRRRSAAWVRPLAGAAVLLLVTALALAFALSAQQRALHGQQQALAALQTSLAERERAQLQRDGALRRELDGRLTALAQLQQDVARRLDADQAQRDAAARTIAGRAAPLRLAFKVAGVRTDSQGPVLRLWFEADPFDAQDRLSAAARARLRTLARAIVMTQERVLIEVAGTAGDAADPTAAQARAQQAAAALRQTGLFPRHAIRALVRAAQPGEPPGTPLVLRLQRATTS